MQAIVKMEESSHYPENSLTPPHLSVKDILNKNEFMINARVSILQVTRLWLDAMQCVARRIERLPTIK